MILKWRPTQFSPPGTRASCSATSRTSTCGVLAKSEVALDFAGEKARAAQRRPASAGRSLSAEPGFAEVDRRILDVAADEPSFLMLQIEELEPDPRGIRSARARLADHFGLAIDRNIVDRG